MGTHTLRLELKRTFSKKTRNNKAILNMLKRIFFLVSMICMVASHPQVASETYKINVPGPDGTLQQIDLSQTYPEGFEGAPLTPADECDGYSCTGLEYKLPNKITIINKDGVAVEKDVFIGQCNSNFPEFKADTEEVFCFVNEDSSCAKKKSNVFKGKFVSSEPCRAANAPKKRGFGDDILEALTTIWNWFSNLFG